MTLALREVVKHYSSGGEVVRAIDGVTLSVTAGEMVALYGPSGSGKTTLLMLAAALARPDRGRIMFDGLDLGQLSEEEASDYRLRDVGVIFQDYELMSGVPVIDNAAMKLLGGSISLADARRRAIPWLTRLGLGHRLHAVPEQLSGGERQRVAIARALASNPRLILADEPTGSLDTHRGRAILELLHTISRERHVGILLVTHDPQAAEVADRVHTLRDGVLVDGRSLHSTAPDDAARIAGM